MGNLTMLTRKTRSLTPSRRLMSDTGNNPINRDTAHACITDQRTTMQNTSHAVMAQRTEPKNSPDDFPTPPWATRALFEHVLNDKDHLKGLSCLEPACGAGHMSKVLKE